MNVAVRSKQRDGLQENGDDGFSTRDRLAVALHSVDTSIVRRLFSWSASIIDHHRWQVICSKLRMCEVRAMTGGVMIKVHA